LSRDWSLDLNFSDSFHWSEPPVLHVRGRDIPLAKYAEPRIRTQLARVRGSALAAARRLDLHGKAATAWRHAFEPVELSADPQVWLQLTPQNAAFAGVRADTKVLGGSLELSGSAETVVGAASGDRDGNGIAAARPGRQRTRRVRCHPSDPDRLRHDEEQDHAGDNRRGACNRNDRPRR
jgi:hypothetical protein